MEKTPSKLVPALIGGSVIGVLSTVPIINMGNCLCCMWILLGGFLGAYLYKRELPPGQEFPSGEGALVGLLSGIFGALFGTFLSYLFMAFGGFNPGQEIIQNFLASRGDLSPELEDFLENIQDGGGISPVFVFVGLFFSLIIDSIFGTIGGIIGAAVFKNRGKTDDPVGSESA